jgi:hypothetical protein
MNGKQAKKLYKMAEAMVTGPLKAKLSDGYNEYNHAMNRLTWTNQVDSDGCAMKDPDGQFLKTLEKAPGTITCAWKVRVMYQALKAQWKAKAHNKKVG